MKAWIIPTIALLVVGGAGFGAGWAINEWGDEGGSGNDEPGEAGLQESPVPTAIASPTPTPYQPRLTGAEAAAIVQSAENTVWDEWGATEGFDLGSDCVTVDFNESIKAWIVQCSDFAIALSSGTRIEQETRTFRLFDESGEYRQVR